MASSTPRAPTSCAAWDARTRLARRIAGRSPGRRTASSRATCSGASPPSADPLSICGPSRVVSVHGARDAPDEKENTMPTKQTNVPPVPEGHRSLAPYLQVRGASRAMDFYAKAFGARELFHMPGKDGKITHAEVQIGDSVLMLADANPEC